MALEAAGIGVWDWDLTNNSIVYSAIAREICGFPADRPVTYEDVVAVTHRKDLQRNHAQFIRATDPAIKDTAPYEYRIVRSDGQVRRVVAHGQVIFADGPDEPKAVRYVGSLQDVTEQRRLEEENRAFTERLRFAMHAGRLGSFEYDVSTRRSVWDTALMEIFGLGEADVAPSVESFWTMIDPRDRRRLRRHVARAYAKGYAYSTEFRVVRPSGEIRWCAGSMSVIRDGAGQATHLYGYTVDITERRRAEAEEAERHAILQSLLDAASLYVGVVEITDDGFVFLMTNKATADFYGISQGPAHIHARELENDPQRLAARRAFLLNAWNDRQAVTIEHPFFHRGKRVAWALGTYTPLPPSPEGRPRLSFVLIDITARKRAEERQQLLMREVDHRAKNALAVAQAVVELTKETDPLAFKRAVVGRVSAIARTHSLLADQRWKGVDLRRLVGEELAPYSADRPEHVVLEGPAHTLTPAAAQLVGLVVHELATNAAKYGALRGDEGSLLVRWSVDAAGALEFDWTESCVFESPLVTPERQGFGLRLLDQTISRQLGGAWTTEWTPNGLSFSMTLPLQQTDEADVDGPQALQPSPPAQPPKAAKSKPSGAPRKVLVVEDEPLIALELESCLEDLGFEVVGRCSTLAAAQAFVDPPPDLAILDVDLAGRTTFSLGGRLRSAGAQVVFSTGYAGVDLPPALAGVPVLVKPVTRETLADALEALWTPVQ
ncbi:MAG: PAS domain-containing protein [Caulobacteraceae bacterium]|nr:PAS domain-containing protein [Caulobacteraceae bacterium]